MVRHVLRVLVLTVLPVLALPVQAQTPERVGTVQGRVVDAATGRPVSAVVVSLSGAGMTINSSGWLPGVGERILTGSDGRFTFRGLQVPGTFTITASKGGYADGASGRRRPGGSSQPVQVSAAATSADVVVQMWKNGAITGTVIDEAGEPVVGVQVRLLSRTASRGRFIAGGPEQVTDDRGLYRFSNLQPADYLVVASPPPLTMRSTTSPELARMASLQLGMPMSRDGGFIDVDDALIAVRSGTVVPTQIRGGRFRVYPTTFHPSAASSAQATVVRIESGEERASIDVQLSPVPTARVSGFVLTGRSDPAAGIPVRLAPKGSPDVPPDIVAPSTFTDATGAFVFAGIAPGQYSLRASGRGGGEGGVFVGVDVPLTVSGENIDGVTAVLAAPPTISVRYQFDGVAPRPTGQMGRPLLIPVLLDSADGDPGPASVWSIGTDRGMSFGGYMPGRYRARVPNSPSGWMFRAAMLNGEDVSEAPFDLTRDVSELVLVFTDRWSGISGSVRGQGAAEATVLAFPADAQLWANPNSRRLKSTRAGTAGEFGIGSLPPGDYYVVAVREEDAADWRDPAFLETLARIATQATILEGEHRKLDLQVREARR